MKAGLLSAFEAIFSVSLVLASILVSLAHECCLKMPSSRSTNDAARDQTYVYDTAHNQT